MKRKVIITVVVLAVALGVIVLFPSVAWISNSGTDKSQTVDISYFDISLIGGCDIRPAYTDVPNSVDYAAPGENMIFIEESQDVWVPGPLTILNKSTILTNIRVRIAYTYITPGGVSTEEVYRPTQNTDFVVDFDEPDDWQYDAATECWNYRYGGTSGTIEVPAATDLINGDIITLINTLGYSSALGPNNVYEDKPVTVTLKVEAKQAQYGTWAQVTP